MTGGATPPPVRVGPDPADEVERDRTSDRTGPCGAGPPVTGGVTGTYRGRDLGPRARAHDPRPRAPAPRGPRLPRSGHEDRGPVGHRPQPAGRAADLRLPAADE